MKHPYFKIKSPAKPINTGFVRHISLFKLLGGGIYLAVSWYTFVCFILHIHLILQFYVPRLIFLEPKWSHHISNFRIYDNIASNELTKASIQDLLCSFKALSGFSGIESATTSFTFFSTIEFHCFPCDLKQFDIRSDHFWLFLNSGTSILTPNVSLIIFSYADLS